jgi:hypothetical protein|tara:strand:+ start:22 stop:294 length:273 start_codon:yes stop_codon:yes gene_type:complete
MKVSDSLELDTNIGVTMSPARSWQMSSLVNSLGLLWAIFISPEPEGVFHQHQIIHVYKYTKKIIGFESLLKIVHYSEAVDYSKWEILCRY